MKFLRYSTFPFAILYWLVVAIRNKLYDLGILTSKSYRIPNIGVGNLVVGGSGKSPIIEYLVKLLSPHHKVATLSRGYGRKTSGFIEATAFSTPNEIGDEPTQFKQKFPDLNVVVSENRQLGMEHLIDNNDVVLLDDAFQHRKVKLGLSILLFDYNTMFEKDWMLPMGNRREPISAKERADIIVITKTPDFFSKVNTKQHLFFSFLKYGELQAINTTQVALKFAQVETNTSILALSGIANPTLFHNYIQSRKFKNIVPITFPDHHEFSAKDFQKINMEFDELTGLRKIILTTEKDAMRLKFSENYKLIMDLPIYYIPIEAEMHETDKEKFDRLILKYVRAN
jgi:tetraacyldisaccharide 4'-kinase